MPADPLEATLEAGSPASEDRAFRRTLGQFGTGVTVVTAKVGEELVGVTANSFSSVSLDPPLVLWSIRRESGSFAAFSAAQHFAVNVLAADQIKVARRFAGPSAERYDGLAWTEGRSGTPIIGGVLAYFECRSEAAHDGGDHVIMVGRVEHFARFERKPLLFVQGRYGVANEHPELRNEPTAATDGGRPPPGAPSLMSLLNRAQSHMSAQFDEHRRAESVSYGQSRILSGIDRHPGLDFEELLAATYLGRREAEDALAEFIARGYVARDPSGRLSLTPEGRERREAIGRRWARFQAERLAGMPADEIEAARRLLSRLTAPKRRPS